MGNLKVILAFAAIYLIWGATYIAAWFGLGSIPPYLMSAIRFLVAGFILLVYSYVRNRSLPGAKSLKINSIAGVLMLVGGSGSVLWAQQHTGSALAAIMVSSIPIWFILLDRQKWSGYRRQPLVITGTILGFLGICLLFGFSVRKDPEPGAGNYMFISIAVLLSACILWTIGSLFVKYRQVDEPITTSTGVQLVAAGFASLLISMLVHETDSFSVGSVSLKAWIGLSYLILMGSVVAYLAYVWLLTVRPAAQVGTFAYVNPVIAVILGAVVANEKIPGVQLLGLFIILSSILLINLPSYKSLK